VVFSATDQRQSPDVALVRLTGEGRDLEAADPQWLTADDVRQRHVNAERLGTALLVGFTQGDDDESRLMRVDLATGSVVQGPETAGAAALERAGDFIVLANGDVAWPTVSDTSLALASVAACR
jgi:hypothetical protein